MSDRTHDPVNPGHYQGTRVMEIIEDFKLDFCLGNCVKYILRHANKNGVEDLRKALWYLCRSLKEPAQMTDGAPILVNDKRENAIVAITLGGDIQTVRICRSDGKCRDFIQVGFSVEVLDFLCNKESK